METDDNTPLPTPTEEQFTALNQAYKYFNEVLFNNSLPGCILNFSRKKNTHGFLAPERWRRVDGEAKYVHEISLTPYTFYRPLKEVFSTLVHEMVHLWQWEFGKPSRNGYHNKQWTAKMEEIGLIPSDTGMKGGNKVGQKMSHYILSGGMYEKAFDAIPKTFLLPFTSLEGDLLRMVIEKRKEGSSTEKVKDGRSDIAKLYRPGKKRTKYTCHNCGFNVWGKPNLNLNCGDCGGKYEVN